MKLHTIITGAIAALTLSTASYANNEPTHSFGLQVGGGEIEYKDQKADSFASSYLFYNYKFAPFYSLEVGLLGASDTDWDCTQVAGEYECFSEDERDDVHELQADDLDLNALVVAIKTDLSLSKRNKLYAKVGLSYYDYQIEFHSQTIADKDGVGYLLEAGWEYQWDQGIGMNVGLQSHKMNDLESNSLNIGINVGF